MTVVVKGNHIERIIVVDDLTASNSILRSVFKAAVPADMKAGANAAELVLSGGIKDKVTRAAEVVGLIVMGAILTV